MKLNYSMNNSIIYACRLCLVKNDKSVAIFSDEGLKNDIQSKIWRLFSFMVHKEENLPQCVCCQCWKTLQFIFLFIAKVEEVQKGLLSYVPDVTDFDERETTSFDHLSVNNELNDTNLFEACSAAICPAVNLEGVSELAALSVPVLNSVSDEESFNNRDIKEGQKHPRDDSGSDREPDGGSDQEDKSLVQYAEIVQGGESSGKKSSSDKPDDTDSIESDPTDASHNGISGRKSRSDTEPPGKARRQYKRKEKSERSSDEIKKGKSSWNPKMDAEIENFYEFHCELCSDNKLYATFNLLCKHYKTEHSVEGYFKCCKRKMYCRSHLYNHMILHTRPELYKCPECDKQLCSPVNLKQHLQLFHLPKTELPYRCSVCGRGFATKAAVENHEKSQHLLTEEEKFVHVCDVCGKRFSSAPGVTEHKKQVHAQIKPLLCDICAKAFPNSSRLHKHMTSHNKSENLKCPHCDKRLKNYGRLQVHLKCHQGVIHSCPHCHKTYPTRRLIQRHIKTHSGERPHVCSICGTGYRESSHLKMHFNKHTGALPFNCQWCPKRFSASGPYYTHRKKMHPEELAKANAELSATSIGS